MRRIILILFLIYSYGDANLINGSFLKDAGGNCVKKADLLFALPSILTDEGSCIAHSNDVWYVSRNWIFHNFPSGEIYYEKGFARCTWHQDQYSSYRVDLKYCVPCELGTTFNEASDACVADTPPIPTCTIGSHYDTDVSQCLSDYDVLNKDTFENGNFIVWWADGASTYCDVELGKCMTHDKGHENRLPNRYINPEINADGSVKYEGTMPEELDPTKSFAQYALEGVGNFIGKTLQGLGKGLIIGGTGDGILLVDSSNPGLNSLNPFATIGGGIFLLGSALITDNKIVTNTPNANGEVTVNLVDKSSTTHAVNLNADTPSDGTPIFSANGIYTQRQITEAGLKSAWENAAGAGTLPPSALILGSDIIYPSKNPDTAIVNTPDKLIFVETKPDNSSTLYEITKNDLANYVNSNSDLPMIKKEISPPVIQNDGTTEQIQTSTPTIINPLTNFPTTTNPSTGLPDYVDYNPKTGLKDGAIYSTATGKAVSSPGGLPFSEAPIKPNPDGIGSNIDLSGVTSRLNKISNQLTKLNDTLGDGELKGHPHNIPSDTSSADWNSYASTWENLTASFGEVSNKVNDVKSLFQEGFTLNLTGGTVTSCPHTFSLNIVGQTSITLDLCSVLSPFRPVIYTFFYLFFVLSVLMFSFKIMLRMV